jgi:ATP-dependent exoDNAse (exonuclease V) beta subunit
MVKPLTIYKASAGSGKTFTLATEYIRLVVENPQCYRNILAVTFTNKATEEMKMRILSQLYGIWKELPDSNKYRKVIRERTGLKDALISERSGMALHNLIYNYSDFRVMTIDTFFQGVLRNLARELDLTANLRVGLNDYQVEELAVDQIIQDLKTTDIILQWLMRYILENISDDKSWNVFGQIKQFGRTIFKDEYKAVSTQIQEKIEEPGFFETYTRQLRDIRQQAKEEMRQVAETFFDLLEGEGLTIDDFLYGKSGVCGFFLKLREGIFDEGVVGKRVLDAMEDPAKWYKKGHPQAEQIYSLAEASLCGLLRHAIDERPRQWKLYKSADLTLRHLTQLRLLGSIEKKVRALNEEANQFLLSDTQQLLHDLIDGSDAPFIFEKMGTQLDHVMIDEFQDTSTVQWQNFKVLLSETMSRQQSGSLIVGDVKQSIYRWRAGDWRLLNDIERQFPHPDEQLDIQTLNTNYRSDRRIIAFNNAFFREAAKLEFMALGESPEAEQLRKAYADVEQQIPDDKPDEGVVDIRLLPQEDYLENTLQQLVEGVKALCDQGVQPSQMAILVRTNALIPVIAQYFMQHLPEVRIVSDEAFRLDASSAVCLLIEALRLLTRPDDLLTKAILVKRYQRDVLHNEANDEQLLFDSNAFDSLLPEAYILHFDELQTMPLYELIERLYLIFNLSSLEDQSTYVCAFFDHLTNFLSGNQTILSKTSWLGVPPRAECFLKEWSDSLCGKTIQSNELSGIRLISIHKSKGLEFDHVFIPFCDWQLEKQGNILWCQPDDSRPFNSLPLVPVDYSAKQLMGTIYEPAYHHEHLQMVVDNLNLLYVAFTRAIHSLHVIGKRNAKNSRSTLIEQVLSLMPQKMTDITLEGLNTEGNPIEFRLTGNNQTDVRQISFRKHSCVPSVASEQSSSAARGSTPSQDVFKRKYCLTDIREPDGPSNPFLLSPTPLPVNIATYENKVEFRQSNRSKAFVEGEDDNDTNSYIRLGNILHELLSTIRTTADIDKGLKRLEQEGVLDNDKHSAEKIITLLRKRLEHPKVAEWFSDKWTLFNECTILSRENGVLKERRPDRVMTDGTNWIVVDFKFAAPKPAHEDQVREYMTLLHQMHPTHSITGYLWYIYPNQLTPVNYKL